MDLKGALQTKVQKALALPKMAEEIVYHELTKWCSDLEKMVLLEDSFGVFRMMYRVVPGGGKVICWGLFRALGLAGAGGL
jgi:hypothetical protein